MSEKKMQQKASGMSGCVWCNEMKGCHELVAQASGGYDYCMVGCG